MQAELFDKINVRCQQAGMRISASGLRERNDNCGTETGGYFASLEVIDHTGQPNPAQFRLLRRPLRTDCGVNINMRISREACARYSLCATCHESNLQAKNECLCAQSAGPGPRRTRDRGAAQQAAIARITASQQRRRLN